jgi:predicted O-linked N-acetylglucosamine transferase (SPINDLY family)
VELKPRLAAMHNNLALALQDQGKLEQAVVCFHHVLRLNPDDAETLSNLGDALCGQGRFDEAVACCRRAVELKPRLAVAHNNLGNAVQRQGKLGEAVACYRIALELKPDFAWAHNNLGNVLKYQGKLDEAVACYHRALELRPDFAEARSNLLYTLQYRAGATLAGLAAAHAEYQRLHAAPLRIAWRQHENVRDPDRPLRLGFVSPDFGRHPVGYFLIRALEHLDRDRWETICYCDRAIHDDLTARFRAAAAVWRDVSGSSDEDLAEMIRADRVDILFDLAGHTAHNRLLVFARKPAPIQITWIGYEGTTGLEAMDYLLADPHVVPPEADANYAERVLRLPQDYICYEPPCESSVVGPLPALVRGSPTFGSFNNAAKITPEVVTVWADILRQVPRASLVLKYRGMDDRATRSHYEELFAARGVPADRLDLRGWSNYAQMLSQYNEIDVALDPFPFGGGITTCNALWMGVPVVTCPGETFASRHGLSHLANVGLTETVARDLREYVQMAVSLAGDLPRLAALRAGLRQRMAASPLCDGKRLAGNLMVVLRDVWRQWVAQGSI